MAFPIYREFLVRVRVHIHTELAGLIGPAAGPGAVNPNNQLTQKDAVRGAAKLTGWRTIDGDGIVNE